VITSRSLFSYLLVGSLHSTMLTTVRTVYSTTFSAEASIIFICLSLHKATPTPRLLSLEFKRYRVDAMAFIRRCWEFLPLEYMTKVAATSSTSDLDAGHEQRLVLMSIDGSWDSVEESRPTTTAREFGAALVEGSSAPSARINSLFLVVFVLSSASALRALLTQNLKLLWGQDRTPL